MLNLDPLNYVSPEVHSLDVERIFGRTWQLLGATSRLSTKGDYIAAQIAGGKVFAVKT